MTACTSVRMRGRLHSPSDECESLETVLISPDSTPESYLWWRVGGERGARGRERGQREGGRGDGRKERRGEGRKENTWEGGRT